MEKLTAKEKAIWAEFAAAETVAAKAIDKAMAQARQAEKKAMAPMEAIVKETRCAANEKFNKVTAKAYDKQRQACDRAYKIYNKTVEPAKQIRDAAFCSTNKVFSQARTAALNEKETLIKIAQEEYKSARDKAAKERDAALRRAK
ncbi:MAG TPA: hypothetical protein VMW93_06400 [bacterium]|nr:hypothetical protein [bacterium]